ncbi:T9SS type A sorting domain-containing protein [Aureispira]|nr:T9SS type A sorting domain-containing protein [Aureispira sp.]
MNDNSEIIKPKHLFLNNVFKGYFLNIPTILFAIIFLTLFQNINAQISGARRSGFTWISTQNVADTSFGAGYTMYSAGWPIFKKYPGAYHFQTGLASSWMTTQRTGNEAPGFYTTIEGGLGWWHDTRFGTKSPKFIMGGVSHNFFSWANGPGAGKSNMLSQGQRDWSTNGGKYGVAQLSNRLLWAPDGLNMAQSLNGEMLGYGYLPLPLTDSLAQTAGVNIETGNQCWTLFFNSTNFKGPATFFLPTYWTEPVLADTTLNGLFLDSRPSDPNVGLGVEQAVFPAIISLDNSGNPYAKIQRIQFPKSGEKYAMILNQFTTYSKTALWNDMQAWFNGGSIVQPGFNLAGVMNVPFINNGGSMIGEITENGQNGIDHYIDLDYIENVQQSNQAMGYEFDLNTVDVAGPNFILPEYFKLNAASEWEPIDTSIVPPSTNLLTTNTPSSTRSEITYLTPKEIDCHWQDPNSPWVNPGPTAGPFTADLGDGSTITYYWYKFIDQPSVINANLPTTMRTDLQARVELIHSNWSHNDEYLAPLEVGDLATIDPKVIVTPPIGLEIGYVPIVTRQEKTPPKIRVFILAGQSNMQGQGVIVDPENDPGDLIDVLQNDTTGDWTAIGQPNNWMVFNDAYLYYDGDQGIIKNNVTVGQGANTNAIGPELMFAQQLDEYYDDPILIVKSAWGGKSLAVDFRPPSASGATGQYYTQMIQTAQNVTQNLTTHFPNIGISNYEISGFVWFQGWNDGASSSFMNEYESNLNHLVNDVRVDLGIPDLPIVIANSGHGGVLPSSDLWVQDIQNVISVAQETVGCNDSIYGGHLGFVDTKPFYLDLSVSPFNGIHHFHNNALTFLNIGKSMGEEMILAINEMAFCKEGCDSSQQVSPGFVSIGNRVWNDLNRDGINDSSEPGIPGVSVVLWEDSDGDGIPDWQGFMGVKVTDSEGYYRFSGLQPGNYVTFVWSVDNWAVGEPLHGLVSTNNYIANANNDIDLDNNGFGNAFTDIMSGIVTLTINGEPLNDGDPYDCLFDYDSGGNNTIDFGFYDPTVVVNLDVVNTNEIQVFPNPFVNELTISGNLNLYPIAVFDLLGNLVLSFIPSEATENINLSSLPKGLYFLKLIDGSVRPLAVKKIIKH